MSASPMSLSRRSFVVSAALAPAPFLLPRPVRAHVHPTAICAPAGLALRGRDAVAYFTRHKEVLGNRDYALQWHGALWLFSNEETMEQFERTPRAFAPQYGGYCAMALAQGHLLAGNPDIWEIDKGRLYILSTEANRKLWDSDLPTHIAEANRNWPGVLSARG